MGHDVKLADKLRRFLSAVPGLQFEEKKMFGGIAFMVNGKMCVNVSGPNLMCRFDPSIHESLKKRKGYQPMVMRGKVLDGYCYVEPVGFKSVKDLEFWIKTCLDFNAEVKPSSKRKTSKG